MSLLEILRALVFLMVATVLEVSGDAIVRQALFATLGLRRIACFLVGAALLFGYGAFLNLAPVPFERVVGLYIATLFVVWQVISYVSFRTLPTTPMLVGGAFIFVGGCIVTFWSVHSN